MSDKKPEWIIKATNNQTGKKLGEVSHVEPKKKAGRKKSKIVRKQQMISISEYQSQKLSNLEGLLKSQGFKLSRGKSETVELALVVLDAMLKNDKYNIQIKSIVKDYIGYEEKMLELEND
jgi:sporulation protein YlmC with PRC-barrel domain